VITTLTWLVILGVVVWLQVRHDRQTRGEAGRPVKQLLDAPRASPRAVEKVKEVDDSNELDLGDLEHELSLEEALSEGLARRIGWNRAMEFFEPRYEESIMFGTNEVILSGALSRTPELAYTPNGKAYVRFTVAAESLVVTSDAQVRRVPFYIAVKLFGDRAEELADCEAGHGVLVQGSLQYSKWEDAEGKSHSRVEVLARRVMDTQIGEVVPDNGGGCRALNGINQVTLCGNLTRDPVLRTTQTGTDVGSFALAVNERYGQGNSAREVTHFIEVTAWGELALENQTLASGTGVLVTGRLVTDSYTDRDGHKRSTVKVEASNLEGIVRRAKPEQPERSARAATPAREPAPRREAAPKREPAVAAPAPRAAQTRPAPVATPTAHRAATPTRRRN
jgi:single-strand DNA-binding protein